MTTYTVIVAVTSDDDALAESVASSVSDFTAELAAIGEGDVHTFISDPVRVTP